MTTLQKNSSMRNWFKCLLSGFRGHLYRMASSTLCTSEEKRKLSKAIRIVNEVLMDWDGNWWTVKKSLKED